MLPVSEKIQKYVLWISPWWLYTTFLKIILIIIVKKSYISDVRQGANYIRVGAAHNFWGASVCS